MTRSKKLPLNLSLTTTEFQIILSKYMFLEHCIFWSIVYQNKMMYTITGRPRIPQGTPMACIISIMYILGFKFSSDRSETNKYIDRFMVDESYIFYIHLSMIHPSICFFYGFLTA